MPYNPLDPQSDPFRPPVLPTLVRCAHCRQEYDSYRIEWRILKGSSGNPHGYWCCPTRGCNGMGFGFDIFPLDPNYADENFSWALDDDGEEVDVLQESDAVHDADTEHGR